LWTGLLLPLGYVFADTDIVKKRFELVIFAIIGISILPMVIEILRERSKSKAVAAAQAPASTDGV
jgi:membrane-associated protein